jgi:RNA polymerase sigma-70 factor (ECF subfamily)
MELGIGALGYGRSKANRYGMTDSLTEQALIERCRKGDSEAYGRFVDLYQARVFGFIKRMVTDADEAADLTQDVFIRAYQHFHRFDSRSSAKTWLFKIGHNLCVDWSRRNKRTPMQTSLSATGEEQDELEVSDSRWEPEKLALDEELMCAVEKAIGSMSDKLRTVLLLHDKEDMAYEDIADALEIPVGTVKSRLFLARTHLQNVLQPYVEQRA